MGCGASKAAQVSEADISIVDHPARRTQHGAEHNEPAQDSTETTERAVELNGGERKEHEEKRSVDVMSSEQSNIERAVKEVTTAASQSAPSTTASALSPVTSSKPRVEEEEQLISEVCMSPDGRIEARAPPPHRLQKLQSAPTLTVEMLQEKQRKVAERKKQELEKKAHSRVSKKDRLRREVMAAREMERNPQTEQGTVSESAIHSRLKEGTSLETTDEGQESNGNAQSSGGSMGQGMEEVEGYDLSVQMEGDTAYNVEETGVWDSQDGLSGEMKKRKQQTSTDTGHMEDNGGEGTALRGGSPDLEGSSNNLEQYM